MNAWHVKPTGSPASEAVTIVTPVAKCPRTSRKRAESNESTPPPPSWSASPSTASKPPSSPHPLRPLVVGLVIAGPPGPRTGSGAAEIDRQSFPGDEYAVETAGIVGGPCHVQEHVDVVVGVAGIVVEQRQTATPASAATCTAYPTVECPHVALARYSSSVYWASWMHEVGPSHSSSTAESTSARLSGA